MAVFRIEKTRNYTVMSNHHLRSTTLSLKAKGLLSLMLSLPDNWDYTTKGLAHICKDGVDSISAGIRELEEQGYLVRTRVRNANGQLSTIEYAIHEQPLAHKPEQDFPMQVIPVQDQLALGNTVQLNIDISSTEESNTDRSSIDSFPIHSAPSHQEEKRREAMPSRDIEVYRKMIQENIDYEALSEDPCTDTARLEEITDLILETVCSSRKTLRIAGDEYPAELVQSKFLKLRGEHIRFVLDCMRENTTRVRNIKKYLLAALFNAPSTIGSYYTAQINHELYRAHSPSPLCHHQAEFNASR